MGGPVGFPEAWPGAQPREPGTQTSFRFVQGEQQDTGSVRVDHDPGLSGKGLCARALYDYQAGTVPTRPPPQAPQSSTRGSE